MRFDRLSELRVRVYVICQFDLFKSTEIPASAKSLLSFFGRGDYQADTLSIVLFRFSLLHAPRIAYRQVSDARKIGVPAGIARRPHDGMGKEGSHVWIV